MGVVILTLIEKFLNGVDFDKVRTGHPPELIFLCGGTDKEDEEKKYFRPEIHGKLIEHDRNVVLAETAMDWQGGQSFSKDLLEFEKYFAALVSLIPIVCESYGSIAELGAFVSDTEIRKKLCIIIEDKFYSGADSKSFIRWGPIKNYEDNVKQKPYCFSKNNQTHSLEPIYDKLINFKPETSQCDFSNNYFHILLLIDIINILSVANITEINFALSYALELAKQKPLKDHEQIKDMLVVLKALDLVKERTIGQEEGYFIARNKEFYLDYRYKPSAEYKKITEIKEQILTDIYSNRLNKNKKVLIDEEEKIGDIEWLKKPEPLKLPIQEQEKQEELIKQDREELIRKAPLLYKVYDIRKKGKGKGTRTIAQPTPKLKQLQRETVLELEEKILIHSCATAYIKNKNGILENAQAHKDSKYFFKYDFKDFFPSIKAADFNIQLERAGYSESERIDLLKIIFRFKKENDKEKTKKIYKALLDTDFNQNTNPNLLNLMIEDYKDEFQLSIGAPSSPFVSNAIMFDFDKSVDDWAKETNFIYTRFADDITISCQTKQDTETITAKLNETLKGLEYPTLQLNDSKQKSVSLKSRVTITGLNITSEHKVSLGRKKKKQIRAMIDHYVKGKFSKHKINELSGWLAYAKAVDNDFFRSMQKKYTAERIASIMQTPK